MFVEPGSANQQLETILGSSSDLSGLKSSFKSFEEREEDYERARARIFSQQSPLDLKEPSSVFDLETPSALTRRKSRFVVCPYVSVLRNFLSYV